MKITPKFYPEMWKQSIYKINVDAWPKVMQAWDEKNYITCISNLLDYINPEIKSKYKVQNQHTYNIPHGSSTIKVNMHQDQLTIIGELVNIDKADKEQLLQKVLDINYTVLKRAKIRLINNSLSICYSSTLSLCEPTKIYEVLKEICFVADHYDDLFIEKYNATLITEPKILKLKSTDKILARSISLAILDETLCYTRYLETLNLHNEIAELWETAVYRIDFTLSPQGLIKSKLEQALIEITAEHTPVNDKIEIGKSLLHFIKNMPTEEFDKHLYQAEVFVTQKTIANIKVTIEKIQHIYTQAEFMISNKNFLQASLYYLHELYELFYRLYINNELKAVLVTCIQNSSEKNWEEAVKHLHNSLNDLLISTQNEKILHS